MWVNSFLLLLLFFRTAQKIVIASALIWLILGIIAFKLYFIEHNFKRAEKKLEPVTLLSHIIHSLSKDLIVHSAYFDSRPRDGHNNVTVMFINVNTTILRAGWILGCGSGKTLATSFRVYSIYENKLMHEWLEPRFGSKPVVYENYLILCYDLSAMNGSDIFAVYKVSESAKVNRLAHSRQPLYYPAPRVSPSNGDNFTVIVCSKAHNKQVPWFREFIQYQKTLGVDHIDFSVLDTFIADDGYDEMVLRDPVVLDALENGFINFRVWPETYQRKREVYLHSENLRKLACIYRHLGTYDFAMPLDTDDFYIPRVPSKRTLKSYISEYCCGGLTGSCRFHWLQMYPNCGMKGDVGPDGNITAHLKSLQKTSVNKFKSVHNIKAVFDASFHDTNCEECLVPGFGMVTVPDSVAYVGHVRLISKNSSLVDIKNNICSKKSVRNIF